jgi:hypothetical protein
MVVLMTGLIGTRMVEDGRTAKEIFEDIMANPARRKFGFGERLAIVNVDFQQAYTAIDRFATAYETDPGQIAYVNRLSALARARGVSGRVEPGGVQGRCRRCRGLGDAYGHAGLAAEHQV